MDVCLGKTIWVLEAAIGIRLCGKMDDGVDIMFLQTAGNVFRRGDVAFEKRKIGVVVQHLGVLWRSALLELIE